MSAAYQDPPFALEDNTDNRSRQTPSVTTQSLGSGSLAFSSSSLRRCKHTWGMRKPDTRDRTASSHTLSKHNTRAPKLPRYCNQPEKSNGKGEGIISCNGNDSMCQLPVYPHRNHCFHALLGFGPPRGKCQAGSPTIPSVAISPRPPRRSLTLSLLVPTGTAVAEE
ncbi:uncharacterized protein CLUP02_12926 [Colletotrichum lupini]|uniref:Uncharacterized protein n=1 Tax=Colletotrichum lupini TaxID=145971 RepID=A0A9Q8T1G9_9PEZI|nr:uncharacterized protein CLUP02_12926 [Colletotrichum lupini]UQC87421.1 hypothetical protein CLUP02_12926 [Colletotrichum lupini]